MRASAPLPAIPAALDRGACGWDACRLADTYTANELAQAIQQINADPASANPDHARGSIHLYTVAARKRTDALTWAIFYHQQARRRPTEATP